MRIIDEARVVELRRTDHPWSEIAALLQVHERTLKRWRLKVNYDDRYEPNMTLQEVVDALLGNSGKVMWTAENRTRGIVQMHSAFKRFLSRRVTRDQVRAGMRIIDPDGPRWRENPRHIRVVFECERPGLLYCTDTCHKLRRWGFIHGSIVDACTRYCLTSWVADNNRSLTLFNEWHKAVLKYGVSELIRSDDGTEVKALEKVQNFIRGPKTFLIGPSTSNVRVECHHGRNTKYSLGIYVQEFTELEKIWLNPYDPLHKFILWHVYSNRMQVDLDMYSEVWNWHKIRTIGRSPIKVWHDLGHRRIPMPNDVATTHFVGLVREKYSFDKNRNNPFTDAEYQEFYQRVPPLTIFDKMDYSGKDRCDLALRVMHDIFSRRP